MFIVIDENSLSIVPKKYKQNCITYRIHRFSDNGFQLNLERDFLNIDEEILLVCSICTDSDLVHVLIVIEKLLQFNIRVLMMYSSFCRNEEGVNFIANVLKKAGVQKINSVDMHNNHDFINNINMSEFWRQTIGAEKIIIAPDIGAISRNTSLYQLSLFKQRDGEKITNINCNTSFDVEGIDCVVVDDIIDTGNTVISASNFLSKNGAKSVTVYATHAVLSKNAATHIQNSTNINKVYVTDTIIHKSLPEKFTVIPILEFVIHQLRYTCLDLPM
jgi:ribose-phosphate pyrophosphokinase